MGMKTKARRRKTSTGISLVDALFSSTQQRTLGLLFGQPERSFFANELIALTGSGSGAVQRELRRLADSGLVTVTRAAGRKYFQANRNAPLFAELRSIVLKTMGLAEPVKAALEPLRPRIKLALVYGSIAKGTDTASSDIDLLLVSDDLSLEQVYAAIAPAERRLARKISVNLYTAEEFRRRRTGGNAFLAKVLAGEYLILIGTERDTGAT
jgi:predicted nucleotidyltransferase